MVFLVISSLLQCSLKSLHVYIMYKIITTKSHWLVNIHPPPPQKKREKIEKQEIQRGRYFSKVNGFQGEYVQM